MRSDLFSQENLEGEGEGLFVCQNSKMVKVELDQGSVQSLAGSMVAYQGRRERPGLHRRAAVRQGS